MLKSKFSVEPSLIGTKFSKSLAVIIPSAIVKEYQIDTSTVFILKYCDTGIFFSYVNMKQQGMISIDTNSSPPITSQQVSVVKRKEQIC